MRWYKTRFSSAFVFLPFSLVFFSFLFYKFGLAMAQLIQRNINEIMTRLFFDILLVYFRIFVMTIESMGRTMLHHLKKKHHSPALFSPLLCFCDRFDWTLEEICTGRHLMILWRRQQFDIVYIRIERTAADAENIFLFRSLVIFSLCLCEIIQITFYYLSLSLYSSLSTKLPT